MRCKCWWAKETVRLPLTNYFQMWDTQLQLEPSSTLSLSCRTAPRGFSRMASLWVLGSDSGCHLLQPVEPQDLAHLERMRRLCIQCPCPATKFLLHSSESCSQTPNPQQKSRETTTSLSSHTMPIQGFTFESLTKKGGEKKVPESPLRLAVSPSTVPPHFYSLTQNA